MTISSALPAPESERAVPRLLLVGNSFPVSLVRVPVTLTPLSLDAARTLYDRAGGVLSYWGHANTLRAAESILERPLAPATERPALTLDGHGLPGINGQHSAHMLILTPTYRPGFRPAIGTENTPADIADWQCLLARFEAIPSTH